VKRVVVLLLLCLSVFGFSLRFSFAQTLKGKSFSLFSHYGYVQPTNDFVKGINNENFKIKNMTDVSLRYEIHTDGLQDWHQLYHYPSFGFGLLYADFHDKNLLGKPFAAYSFLSMSYYRSKRFNLRGEFSLGLAWNWKHFSKDNPLNVAIGSAVTYYIAAELQFYYFLNRNLDIGLGISTTHFSNGALSKPNKGINVISPRLTLRYLPLGREELKHRTIEHSFKKGFDFVFMGFGGAQSYFKDLSFNDVDDTLFKTSFMAYGLTATALRTFSPKSSLGLGMDITYFESAGNTLSIEDRQVKLNDPVKPIDKVAIGLFVAYEYKIRNLSLTFEPGIYLHKYTSEQETISDPLLLYQRIGVRYQIDKNFFVGMKLRAYNFSVAHIVEWQVGYRL
jgi:hypothetical protein